MTQKFHLCKKPSSHTTAPDRGPSSPPDDKPRQRNMGNLAFFVDPDARRSTLTAYLPFCQFPSQAGFSIRFCCKATFWWVAQLATCPTALHTQSSFIVRDDYHDGNSSSWKSIWLTRSWIRVLCLRIARSSVQLVPHTHNARLPKLVPWYWYICTKPLHSDAWNSMIAALANMRLTPNCLHDGIIQARRGLLPGSSWGGGK